MQQKRLLQKKFFLILYGPTGVGKSEIALSIAEQVPSEIINMDVGQFYTPLTIGTAKPVLQNVAVPHHLFNIIEEPKDFTVVQYRKAVRAKLDEIWQRGKLPILVGGSGFYLKSLFFPPAIHEVLENKVAYAHLSDGQLWEHLYHVDPERARRIHRADIYRIKRALDIWFTTGKKPSSCIPIYKPLGSFLLLFLTRNRQELYARIDERVHKMMDAGWLQEVKALHSTEWESFLKEKKLIGYNELLSYEIEKRCAAALAATGGQADLDNGKMTMDQVIKVIQKRTRHYAKRQLVFWKMLEKQLKQAILSNAKSSQDVRSAVEEVNLSSPRGVAYISNLVKKLLTLFS